MSAASPLRTVVLAQVVARAVGRSQGNAQALALAAAFGKAYTSLRIIRRGAFEGFAKVAQDMFSNQSWLRAITLCQDAEGFWLAFTQVSPEGPDMIVYLPVTHILSVAVALETVAECDDKTYRFVPSPVFGKDYWSKPARVNGAAYMLAACRYRPVLVFNGAGGIWIAQLVSGRHAKIVARLLRMQHQRYGVALAPV